MNIHEFQAKKIFSEFGVPVPLGMVARAPEAAGKAYRSLGRGLCLVKAQVHAGGRGKAGGIKMVHSAEEAQSAAARLLGTRLVTPQTGAEGRPVRQVLIQKGSDIERELYVGITLDRAQGCPVMIASTEGGMEIEEVAARTPERIYKEPVDVNRGLEAFRARRLVFQLGLGDRLQEAVGILQGLARIFLECDASLLEVNPWAVTQDGKLLALDGKINFDESALGRHPKLAKLRDLYQELPAEAQAHKAGLSYVGLDGSVGCMVNGAGLAMATMDLIKLHGGWPANFLDVGGGATPEQVTEAFRIILKDKNVKAILVNIFGGIVKCDLIAQGILQATERVKPKVPLVVRLEGTNVEEGRRLLAESRLSIIPASDLNEAAKLAVDASGK
ncbi:MAG: ADP-forming succinate--CoA ligase subunit beta [Candidatus Omnitrophica bacterium]|nr:ADP-forming succinate--CoA ligase subunit beta [Candidatus Omnitrophota bacterium]